MNKGKREAPHALFLRVPQPEVFLFRPASATTLPDPCTVHSTEENILPSQASSVSKLYIEDPTLDSSISTSLSFQFSHSNEKSFKS